METACAIKETFRRLVPTKPYEKITILEICKDANVSRKTFYRYFEGKEDIALALFQDDFVHPVTTLQSLLPLDEIKSSTQLMMQRLHRTFQVNMDYYAALIEGIGKQAFVDLFIEHSGKTTYSMFIRRGYDEVQSSYVADILNGAQALSLIWWLGHRDLSVKQMADLNMQWVSVRVGESWTEGDS
jgi:AcrR family transcriptional regulator